MGYQDRPYFRDRPGGAGGPLMWIVSGSLPLFTAFGIRVRAHSSLVIYVALTLLFGLGPGFSWQDRGQSMAVLFGIVLLHEFGHCFTARWVGGEAEDILMHPLGGLAFARPPRRPLPTFLTVAGGPAVNVLVCIVCGSVLWGAFGWLPWNPFRFHPIGPAASWLNVWRYLFWIYQISYTILIFNLLPIFPLDGGQMLQSILWPKMGYYRSTKLSCEVGMAGAVVGGMYGIISGNLGLAVLAAFGFMTCSNLRQQLLASGASEYSDDVTDYRAAYEPATPRRRSDPRKAARRAERVAAAERSEQVKIDAILAKVSAQGMQSLNWWEKRTLRQASERQRARDQARAAKFR